MARTRIKFCGLVRPEDVRLAATLGIDAVGLVFYEKSPRLLQLEEARALRAVVPSWMAVAGLFVNSPAARVQAHSSALGLDVVQFHGDESPEQCRAALLPGQPYWRAVRVRGQADLLNSWAAFPDAESFLLDAFSDGYGGSGESFDWSVIPADHQHSLIVSGGLDAGSVGGAITRLNPVAVDVSSGIQGANPREKDAGKMESFVTAVAGADARKGMF